MQQPAANDLEYIDWSHVRLLLETQFSSFVIRAVENTKLPFGKC